MESVAPLYVEDSGTGETVVLLHSSGMSGRQWRRLATSLVARGMRVIVPDFTGHGRSPAWPEPKPFSCRIDVEHLVRLTDTLGSVHLVGHSYGGLIALLATIEAPSRVRSLVLYDPVAFGVLDPTLDADAHAELRRVPPAWDSREGGEAWLEGFVDYWGGAGAWRALREDVRAEFRRVGWVVYQGVTSLVREDTPASAYRGRKTPVTLLTGENSPLAAHRVVERLAESFEGSRVVTVAGAGHMGPLTHAEAVHEAVFDALPPA